ncbi:MAG: hypothetical protein D4R83_07380 [Streptomycetaceae bacterium]|jgi:hypothetical protein|nr:MAG: hypothetical protein D4R83_07380 [Streptomycetaceae bacterium]
MKNLNLITKAPGTKPHVLTTCDSCPAKSRFTISLVSGSLDFCRHHFLKNQKQLILIAIHILEIKNDETI